MPHNDTSHIDTAKIAAAEIDGGEIDAGRTVADLVEERPYRSRFFDAVQINYCCQGNVSLDEACRMRGLDPTSVVDELERLDAEALAQAPSLAELSGEDLVAYARKTFHAFVNEELARVVALVSKVAEGHGDDDPRLREVAPLVQETAQLMLEHGQTEAAYLFPSVLNGSAIEPAVTASLRDSGEKLRAELESLRVLTDGYSVPEWACNSVRATMDALSRLDETTSTHTKTVFETLLARVS